MLLFAAPSVVLAEDLAVVSLLPWCLPWCETGRPSCQARRRIALAVVIALAFVFAVAVAFTFAVSVLVVASASVALPFLFSCYLSLRVYCCLFC